MTAFERLLRRDSLDRREQEAFSELADTLIFGTPQHLKMSRENIREFSRRVQDAFYAQDEMHERARQEYLHDIVLKALDSVKDTIRELAEERRAEHQHEREEPPKRDAPEVLAETEKTPTEQFVSAAQMYIVGHGREYWQSQGYGAWGFTPALANVRSKEYERPYETDGKNCFGVVQGLAARFRDQGLEPKMAITADHPFAVVEIEGKTYLTSLFGVQEAKGVFAQHDGYSTYLPSPEDKLPYKLMLVWDFDEALVYEQLENFEVLRQMSLGNKVENLPGTKESGMKIADQHRGTLQAADWRAMQRKLTPGLSDYFQKHAGEWKQEVERMHLMREVNHAFNEVMAAAQQATSYKGRPHEDFRKEFLPLAKQHSDAVAHHLMIGLDIPADVPGDVVLFAKEVRGIMDAIPHPQLKEHLMRAFLRPFLKNEIEVVSEERLTGE